MTREIGRTPKYERERESVCVCVSEREREREPPSLQGVWVEVDHVDVRSRVPTPRRQPG